MLMNAWKLYVNAGLRALRQALGSDGMYGRDLRFLGYSKRATEALRVALPYCLHPVDETDAGGPLIWLNRNYKPLGVHSDTGGMGCGLFPFVDYRDFPQVHIARDHPAARHLFDVLSPNRRNCVYLFADLTAPWYRQTNALRLARLLEEALRADNVSVLEAA